MSRPPSQEEMTQVTLYLPVATWKQFRIYCLKKRISASQLVGKLLVERLQAATEPPESETAQH